MYIHEKENWTDFYWNNDEIAVLLDDVTRAQGRLIGRLQGLGFDSQLKATSENLLYDIVSSSEIEGISMNADEVRSSIANKLGIENATYTSPSHYVDNVVSVVLDAMEHYQRVLTKEQLCIWQSSFFPSAVSNGKKIETGMYRTGEEYVVSGMFGKEKVHYIAPSPDRVEAEMQKFISWFNNPDKMSPVLRSAVAHIWFVTIHPFEDGNGRLARILADMLLARADGNKFRYYNVSSEICRDKKHYYEVIERIQHGNGDLTEWFVWYLNTLKAAIETANITISRTLTKTFFWMHFAQTPITERQRNTLNIYLDGYEAKITAKNWAALNKCSHDTAGRDIADLVTKQMLIPENPEAKRMSYVINYTGDDNNIIAKFKDVKLVFKDGQPYLSAIYNGEMITERILHLDADRVEKNKITVEQIIGKYFSHYI